MQSKDDFILKLTYSHGINLIDSIQNNSEVMILEIDSEHTDPSFLTEDSFYGVLNSADNLFFIDITVHETVFTSQNESQIHKKLSSCSDSSLIMQFRSKSTTKIFVKVNKKETIVLDLCNNSLLINEEEFKRGYL